MLNNAICFKQIFIVTGYTDLRSGIDRLAALITSKTGDNPFVPDTLYLFCGRKTNHQVPVPGKNYRKVIWCNKMKIISIAAVTAGGKTTIVNELKKQIPNTKSLHFDEYSFEGEVDDFYTWTKQGADYNVWNLKPLIKDILEIKKNSDCEYLLLDYPFAYCHKELSQYIDCAIFIDTPLDIAMARRILRDMGNATGDEIRQSMELYLKYARIAYIQMIKDVLPSSDYIIDGTKELSEKTDEIIKIMLSF